MLSPADAAVAGRDASLPGLALLLDPAALQQAIASVPVWRGATEAVLTYLRYKPRSSCLAGVTVQLGGETRHLLCKAFAAGNEAKWLAAQRDPRAAALPTQRAVLWSYLDDPALRGPRWLASHESAPRAQRRLGLAWSSLTVLAHKPQRRLVLRASTEDGPTAVLKCYQPGAFARAARVHDALQDTPVRCVSPAIGRRNARHVLALPWVDGEMLRPAIDSLSLFASAGRELATLHALRPSLEGPPHARSSVESLIQGLQDTIGWLPEHQQEIDAAAEQLTRRIGADRRGADALLHGDFYAKQLLATPVGVQLLDLDDCRYGDPHIDLGQFAAHVERDIARGDYTRARGDDVVDALRSGYADARPIVPVDLAVRTAEALLRIAPHPFRHRQADWPTLTMALVRRAVALLDSSSGVRGFVGASSNRSLMADAALAAAHPLLDRRVATSQLNSRRSMSTPAGVEVTRTSLVRHKPGRRCVIAFDLVEQGRHTTWLGKVRAKGTDHRAARVHSALWGAGLASIAEPLGTVDTSQMTLQRAVPGVTLGEALARSDDVPALGAAVAHALRALHATTIDTERTWSVKDEWEVLERALTDADAEVGARGASSLATLRRGLASAAARLARRAQRATVHRDFHHDQVVVGPDRCWLVDLDLVASGDPTIDVGNFTAHLIEHGWRHPGDAAIHLRLAEAFLRAYGAPSRDAQAMCDWTLLSLGRLVGIAARRADRVAMVHTLIEHTRTLLSRACTHPHELLEAACHVR